MYTTNHTTEVKAGTDAEFSGEVKVGKEVEVGKGAANSFKAEAGADATAAKVGFFATAPVVKQDVSTSPADGGLANLLTALTNYGLITTSSSSGGGGGGSPA